ncbi:DUF2332 domain-containing protein [Gimesia aquarii]|uniref:DUF2332 domain-containing protein n=1 Tax=Gimesia aquarii TaxID=2527964 RepID=A0A517W2L3_9PLAN|nr:DUF2332 domain-containing protein [Gimesia aquarii]QDT99486.1 hypothetical protein V144x_49970 [Gimesia aquarii]
MSHRLAEKFRNFAERECKGTSPLYYILSHSIAQDNDVLEIAGQVQKGQPVPNLFFAAVHYLLVSGSSHPLAAFYASCAPEVETSLDAWPEFKDFVHSHRQIIVSLLQSRFVQTNEVRRCAFLFPAFLFAASQFKPQPLALLEIGTSAGLNLLWDQYQYSYGDSTTYGDTSSPVLIRSRFRGNKPSVLSEPVPEISHRIGADLNIIDLSHPDEVAWLRALVWPEHHERRDLMDAALEKRGEMQPDLDLRMGDGFAMLDETAEEIPTESLFCVYHTHVANQISKTEQEAFLSSIQRLGKQRDIVHLFNNIAQPHLHLSAYRDGQLLDLPLAKTDGHARWIEWL